MSVVKSKYNIGDTVWYINGPDKSARAMSTTVKGVILTPPSTNYGYSYVLANFDDYSYVHESHIFKSEAVAKKHIHEVVAAKLEHDVKLFTRIATEKQTALDNLRANEENS